MSPTAGAPGATGTTAAAPTPTAPAPTAPAPTAPTPDTHADPDHEPDQQRVLRIGEVAELTGTTPRTIRYWEEVGLLGAERDRAEGKHRLYSKADVQRVSEIVRLRDLLGLSLEQLSQLLEAESARAALRRELHQTEAPAERRRILAQLQEHISTQLQMVRSRLAELTELATELEDKQRLVSQRIRESSRS